MTRSAKTLRGGGVKAFVEPRQIDRPTSSGKFGSSRVESLAGVAVALRAGSRGLHSSGSAMERRESRLVEFMEQPGGSEAHGESRVPATITGPPNNAVQLPRRVGAAVANHCRPIVEARLAADRECWAGKSKDVRL